MAFPLNATRSYLDLLRRNGVTVDLPRRTAADWRADAEESRRHAEGEISLAFIAETAAEARVRIRAARHQLHRAEWQLMRAIEMEG